MAFACGLQHGGSDAEGAVFEGEQVDPAHHDIAPEMGGIEFFSSEIGRDGRKVLRLDQRYLPGPAVTVIAEQAITRVKAGLRDGRQRFPPGWTQADPHDFAGPHWRGQQRGEGRRRVQQDVSSRLLMG